MVMEVSSEEETELLSGEMLSEGATIEVLPEEELSEETEEEFPPVQPVKAKTAKLIRTRFFFIAVSVPFFLIDNDFLTLERNDLRFDIIELLQVVFGNDIIIPLG